MLKNCLKLAFCNQMRGKLTSVINIFGLAFGVGLVTLIGQFLYFEFSTNKFHEKIDRIYRLVDLTQDAYAIDYRLRDKIIEETPQVRNASLLNRFAVEANYDNQSYKFEDMLIVDSAFFEVFSVRFIYGTAQDAVNTIDAVVLTQSTARKLFGESDPLGRSIRLDHKYEMSVTGVIEDLPATSSFQADLLVSAENTRKRRLSLHTEYDDDQCKYLFNIFLELHEESDPSEVAEQISSLHTANEYRFPGKVRLSPKFARRPRKAR